MTDISFLARSKITEHVETFSFIQKTLKIENHVLDSIETADQVETIRRSMRCRAGHVHKKQKCRINTIYEGILGHTCKRMNSNNENKREKRVKIKTKALAGMIKKNHNK